jgi:hypothetical protein
MAKLKPNEKRAQLSFQRPEDIRLFSFLEKRAYEARYDLGVFILVSLQEAFKGQIEEDEVNALAEEAARKVRDRTNPEMVLANDAANKLLSGETKWDTPVEPPPAKPVSLSMDQAQKQAEAQIASLDAIASTVMKKKVGARKGVPSPPPMPQ